MVQEQPVIIRKCEGCGKEISETRLAAVSGALFCVQCQHKLEQEVFDQQNPEVEEIEALEILEDRLAVGDWSANLMEIADKNAELRGLMRSARWRDARKIVQSQVPQVQAALVTLDENPEEVLSLTGMNEEGTPVYSPKVVDLLPTEILAELIVPRNSNYLQYNPEVIRAMSPKTFSRAVAETLDSVDYQPLRTKVMWDWMQAVASMDDKNKAAELLREMDLDTIEDAVMDRIDGMGLEKTLIAVDGFGVSRLKALSEGMPGGPPGRLIDDPE
ncbi:MAG: TraR/DksA C4-type zinc finger protein, partial [Anaerolineae bacterium]|nr:TraR/DksA C4-type zinc finger protein [Anaerolineae bacterium]